MGYDTNAVRYPSADGVELIRWIPREGLLEYVAKMRFSWWLCILEIWGLSV